jgi:deoxyribodipyrimidine photo-lyase
MTTRKKAPALLWLRQDLRLHDHPALHAAVGSGRSVLPIYLLDDAAEWGLGGASSWWLHHSLASLSRDLRERGATLVLRRGGADEILNLALEIGAAEVHLTQPHEPSARAEMERLSENLRDHDIALHRHAGAYLFDPADIRSKAGRPFGVFTPFARACRDHGVEDHTLPAPARIQCAVVPASDRLEDWNLLPARPDWAGGLRTSWTPGEGGADRRLRDFLANGLSRYATGRDAPGQNETSMLSPHLHWGEISPRHVWRQACAAGNGAGLQAFLNELLWREFSAYQLWHHPDLSRTPLRREFAAMEWHADTDALRAWQRGQTGIPMVDAGMRQLWQTGWMHNRVRMIVASFLIKHLLIRWQDGAAWFWDTLVDADLASNSANWQWVAGCGADAAPFFRVFNPVLQGQKFDPDGIYVRRFVPELGKLPNRYIHAPWEAPKAALTAAGVTLGRTYPQPLIDLRAGRERALDAFRKMRGVA